MWNWTTVGGRIQIWDERLRVWGHTQAPFWLWNQTPPSGECKKLTEALSTEQPSMPALETVEKPWEVWLRETEVQFGTWFVVIGHLCEPWIVQAKHRRVHKCSRYQRARAKGWCWIWSGFIRSVRSDEWRGWAVDWSPSGGVLDQRKSGRLAISAGKPQVGGESCW